MNGVQQGSNSPLFRKIFITTDTTTKILILTFTLFVTIMTPKLEHRSPFAPFCFPHFPKVNFLVLVIHLFATLCLGVPFIFMDAPRSFVSNSVDTYIYFPVLVSFVIHFMIYTNVIL